MINQFEDELELEQEEDTVKLAIQNREKATDRSIRLRLQKILRKNDSELLLDDKKFLKARASYLSKGQREEYADIINADYSGQAVAPVEPKLEDLTRSQLEEKARELGVEKPEELPNKKAVIEAIQKAQ